MEIVFSPDSSKHINSPELVQACTSTIQKQTNMQRSKESITFPPWYRKKNTPY
jgi:hypothetical protein